jgi:hypothetical protein
MSQSQPNQDNRQHARFELLDYALMQGDEAGQPAAQRAIIVDVSLGGLQIRSRNKFNHGDVFRLTVGRADSSPVLIAAEVRYSIPIEDSDLFATGFKVRPEDNEQRINWVDYVHTVFQSQGETLTF